MATTIVLLGEKGGSGKTTLAVNIAAELAARGSRVLLVDGDPQGTAITWAGISVERELEKIPTTIALGENLRQAVPGMAADYDWCVIDLPGRTSKRAVGALMLADVALLPCSPSAADAWALTATADLVGNALELRPELRVGIVLNRGDHTSIGAGLREALSGLEIPILSTTIGNRVAFREALTVGEGVTTYKSGSVAANEIRRLVDEIEALLLREAA